MQFKSPVIIPLLTVLGSCTTASQGPDQGLGVLLSEIPACAWPCLNQAITSVGCGSADYTCMCNHHQQVGTIGLTCLNGACSEEDVSQTQNITGLVCDQLAPEANSTGIQTPSLTVGIVPNMTVTSFNATTTVFNTSLPIYSFNTAPASMTAIVETSIVLTAVTPATPSTSHTRTSSNQAARTGLGVIAVGIAMAAGLAL